MPDCLRDEVVLICNTNRVNRCILLQLPNGIMTDYARQAEYAKLNWSVSDGCVFSVQRQFANTTGKVNGEAGII